MADWDDVERAASALPEVTRHGEPDHGSWKVKGKHFAWARPLRRADHEALGEAAPDGPILGVSVPELVSKGVLMAARPNVYFTTPHFDGYKAILVQLDAIDVDELGALLLEAWLARAPKRLARAYLDEARERGDVG